MEKPSYSEPPDVTRRTTIMSELRHSKEGSGEIDQVGPPPPIELAQPPGCENTAPADCTEIQPRYRFECELAQGGMGTILKCHDTLLLRDVAVKVLLRRYQHDNALRARFVREARILSQLQHPCIAPVYDMGETIDGRPFFAMKLVEGQSLAEILAERTEDDQSDRGRTLSIIEQVCQALAYAHAHGVVHLDIKPSNIMIGRFGEVQLMDWGLARVVPDTPVADSLGISSTQQAASEDPLKELILARSNEISLSDESVQGTPAYMSPEQALGKPMDVRADVFGIGAVLCEILCGQPPYSGSALGEVYGQAARADLESAWQILKTCNADRGLIQLAKQCLSPNREDRPRDAAQVSEYLAAYVQSALQTAESDLKRFFDLNLDLFCIANTEGYFLRINDNFSRVLGYCRKELIALPFLEFVHEDDKEKTLEAISVLSEGSPLTRFCNRYRRSDGRFLLFEWTAKSFPEEKIIFAVARVIDAQPES